VSTDGEISMGRGVEGVDMANFLRVDR
jgi:hypothetical protein